MDSHPYNQKQLTILAVDDTPDNLSLLLTQLSSLNYKTLVAESGVSALQQVEHVHPDLILLDVLMPKLDGYETCRLLKLLPQCADVPILFLTALSDTVDKVRGFEAGGVDYITKPIDIAVVSARIQTHLQNSQLAKQLAHQNQLLKDVISERDAALALQKRLRVQSENNLEHVVKLSKSQSAQMHNTVHSLVQTHFQDESVWHLLHQPVFKRLGKLHGQIDDLQTTIQPKQNITRPKLAEHISTLRDTALLVEGDMISLAPRLQLAGQEHEALATLSARERDVLTHIADGVTTDEIAMRLNLSPATVRTYRVRVMNKLDIHNIPGLVKFAILQGLSTLE